MEEVQAVIRQRSLLKRLFGHFKCSKAELSFSIGLGSFIACGVAHFVEGSKFVPSSFPTEWALPLIALSIAPIFWITCVFMFNKGWIDLDHDQTSLEKDFLESSSIPEDPFGSGTRNFSYAVTEISKY